LARALRKRVAVPLFRATRRGLTAGIVIPIVAASTMFATVSAAEENPSRIFIQNTNPEFVVGSPENPANTYTVEALVSGDMPGEVFVEFVDYFSGSSGRQGLPGGTLPNSLQNAIELVPSDLSYTPNQKTQVLRMVFRPKPSIEQRIYSGGIRIGFAAASDEDGFASTTLGVVKNLIVSPFGAADLLDDDDIRAAEVSSLKVSALQRSSFIDRLVPDFPGVINHGPVEVVTRIENNGSFPVFVSGNWQFLAGGELLAVKQAPSELLGGGRSVQRSIQTLYVDPATQRSINVLPGFGVVEIRTELISELTGVEIGNLARTDRFLVLQWKEPLVGLLVILLLWRLALRYRKAELIKSEL